MIDLGTLPSKEKEANILSFYGTYKENMGENSNDEQTWTSHGIKRDVKHHDRTVRRKSYKKSN